MTMKNKKYLEFTKKETKNNDSKFAGAKFWESLKAPILEKSNTEDEEEIEEESEKENGEESEAEQVHSTAFSLKNPKKNEETIRITMLGASTVGKTVFLSSIKQTLMSDPDEFFFSIDADDEKEQHKALNRISIVDNETVIGFPASGTSETTTYELTLKDTHETFFTFEFWDYRGGLVSYLQPGKDLDAKDERDVEQFKAHLVKSDVILVFVDGIKVSQYDNAKERHRYCQADLMNNIFTNVLKTIQKPYHVILVVTKADDSYVKEKDKEDNYKGLCEKAVEIFEKVKMKSHTFAVIPVYAVGEKKTETTEVIVNNRKSWNSKIKDGAYPEPMNADLVMIYACRHILQDKLNLLIAKRDELYRIGKELKQNKKMREKDRKVRETQVWDELEEIKKQIETLDKKMEHMNENYKERIKDFVYFEKEPKYEI